MNCAAHLALLIALVTTAMPVVAGEPVTESSHPLEMVLVPSAGGTGRGLLLDVVVHNPTPRKVFLQTVTPEVFAIHTSFVDGEGEPVEGMHTWATRGRPMMSHRFFEIAAGESLHLDQFELIDAESRATGGGMRWDVRSYRGQTLKLSFTFSQDCSGRTTEQPDMLLRLDEPVHPKRLKDVFCGKLTTPEVAVTVPPWTRASVLATLVRDPVTDEAAYDVLISDALGHEAEAVRQNAAFSLGEIGRPEAAAALVPLLTDPVREVRGYAARSLGDLRNPVALPALEAASTHEQDDWVRGAIFRAIEACQP